MLSSKALWKGGNPSYCSKRSYKTKEQLTLSNNNNTNKSNLVICQEVNEKDID
jgi:hypothetical protein